MKRKFNSYIEKLQDRITQKLAELDGKARFKEDFWDDTNFVDEYCPRCGCTLRYDEGDICCSCEELKKEVD